MSIFEEKQAIETLMRAVVSFGDHCHLTIFPIIQHTVSYLYTHLSTILSFVMYKSFTSLITFTPMFLKENILDAIINRFLFIFKLFIPDIQKHS